MEHFTLMAGGVNFLLLTLFVAFSESKFLGKQKIPRSCDMIQFVSPGCDIPALEAHSMPGQSLTFSGDMGSVVMWMD